MDITVIGAGNMGSALVKQLSAAGHRVSVTSRNLDKARALSGYGRRAGRRGIGPGLGRHRRHRLRRCRARAAGRWATCPGASWWTSQTRSRPITMGLTLGLDTSAAEQIAKALPGADVVKAFNTLFAHVLANGPTLADGQTAQVFYAGGSERGKQTVAALIDSIGFKPVDAGALKNARYLEPLAGSHDPARLPLRTLPVRLSPPSPARACAGAARRRRRRFPGGCRARAGSFPPPVPPACPARRCSCGIRPHAPMRGKALRPRRS